VVLKFSALGADERLMGLKSVDGRPAFRVFPHRRRQRRWSERGPGIVALSTLAVVATLVLGSAITAEARTKAPTTTTAAPSRPFTYGYDLAKEGPYNPNDPASQSARQVMATFPGTYVDVPIMGWGPTNPEATPGVYDFTEIAKRVALVQSTGGIPVITLAAAPDWMKGGAVGSTDWSLIDVAPLAQHYQDFATLSAKIAQAFPQVRAFVVWKEMKGFWSQAAHKWDAAGYTTMYNDVYRAIKAVRPDANVGGPYVSVKSYSTTRNAAPTTPSGPWGTLDQTALDAISYWMANKVGADFVAIDGTAFTKDLGLITDPVTSTAKYAAADGWLAARTTLPIDWMEFHLLPDPTLYTDQQQAAIRVAALIEMASSGASVGIQWQAEQIPGWDEGLWTSTAVAGGGQPTVLGQELPAVLKVLAVPVTLVPNEPPGVVAATGANGTVTATMSGATASVVVTP
jgi:hypothetical protein